MRYWEDFETGQEAEHGSHTITEAEIVEFASRYDPQPFHVDPEAAAAGPFGGLIASGWQTASIYMGLYVRALMLDTAGMGSPGVEELRWLAPVRPGDVLTARSRVLDAWPSENDPGPRHRRRRERAREPARRGRHALPRADAHRA